MADLSLPGVYIYVCTRLQIRKGRLISREHYLRLLHMSFSEIVRVIGEGDYRMQVLKIPGGSVNPNRIEQALIENLVVSFQRVLKLTPGNLGTLTSRYLARWDIINVMLVLHGKAHRISDQRIRDELIPAGELDRAFLETLIHQESIEQIVPLLRSWALYPEVSHWYHHMNNGAGRFARLENRLYKRYYSDLLHALRNDSKTDTIFIRYTRLEIDLVNIRNLFRLRSGGVTQDIDHYLIPGGTIDLRTLGSLYEIEEKSQFIEEMKRTGVLKIVHGGLQELNRGDSIDSSQAGEMIWRRWQRRRTPIHEVEMAVTRARLAHMDHLALRHPFSALPVLSYLERKKYEVYNLRALTRGKEYGLQSDLIHRYLVI